MTDISADFTRSLLSLDRVAARDILSRSRKDMSSLEFIDGVIVQALSDIGRRWEAGTVALSQVYMSGRICEELVVGLLPEGDSARRRQPKMAIAVLSDYHLLGKRIVASCLRASGFALLDYDRVDVEGAIRRATEDRLEILLISTLMLHSALKVGHVVEGLRAQGHPVKVVVGGAPFRLDDQLWRQVGADAMGKDAGEAVTIVSGLIEEVAA